MNTLKAVHRIHMTLEPGKPGDKAKGISPTPPKSHIIMPGNLFKAQNEDQEAKLLKEGAATIYAKAEKPAAAPAAAKATGNKKAAAKPAEKPAEAPAPEADGEGDGDDDDDDDTQAGGTDPADVI